jgi:hypothetical protein
MVRFLGGEKVGVWCVFWVKRWSVYAALDDEQLDEWQLYVEGRERAYGFLGEEMVCVGRGTAGRVAIVR